MILSDNETKIDLLNNEAVAKTIVTLVWEKPEHPVTVGVHGDWGAGKIERPGGGRGSGGRIIADHCISALGGHKSALPTVASAF
jgi:hypothetical protein